MWEERGRERERVWEERGGERECVGRERDGEGETEGETGREKGRERERYFFPDYQPDQSVLRMVCVIFAINTS